MTDRCPRCGGWCTEDEVETEEGESRLSRCVNWGARYEALANLHRTSSPRAPYPVTRWPMYTHAGTDDALDE
jgi:hypothetical protein